MSTAEKTSVSNAPTTESSALVRWVAAGAGYQGEDQFRATLAFLRPHKKITGVALIAMVVAAGLEGGALTVFALAIQSLIRDEGATFAEAFGPLGSPFDALLGALSPTATFFSLVGMVVAMVAARGALTLVSEFAASLVYVRVFTAVWDGLFRQFMSISYASFSKYRIGDLSQYIWDAKNVHSLIWQTNNMVSVAVVSAVYLGVMFLLSWQMTLVAIASLVLLMFSLRGLMNRLRVASQVFVTERIEMATRATEYLSGGREVRLYGMEAIAASNVRTALDRAMKQTRLRMVLRAAVKPSMEILAVAGVAVFLLIGIAVLGDFDRGTTLPKLLAFIAVIYRLLPQAGAFNEHRAAIIDLAPVSSRVTEMLRTDNKSYLPDGEIEPAPLQKGIRLQNVTLRYVAGERPALENVSFDIPAGKMTALVGPSGAGKSTVADMLMRLYDPTSGCILADGNDLRELRVASWRSRIGTVSQDAYMFNDTIRNNIALGNPRATDDDIRQAARAAMADEFISGLENGYDTVVGDRGYRISGGQRQRIAIARALLRKPEILVFDEATSSLDSGSERMIVEAIDRIRKDHTVLVIAHRLSTIAGADNIVVLDRGGLVESGQHGELVRADGEYSQLWRFQTEGTART